MHDEQFCDSEAERLCLLHLLNAFIHFLLVIRCSAGTAPHAKLAMDRLGYAKGYFDLHFGWDERRTAKVYTYFAAVHVFLGDIERAYSMLDYTLATGWSLGRCMHIIVKMIHMGQVTLDAGQKLLRNSMLEDLEKRSNLKVLEAMSRELDGRQVGEDEHEQSDSQPLKTNVLRQMQRLWQTLPEQD